MELFEATKKEHCAICGAEVVEDLEAGYYEDGYFHEPFKCSKCGNEGQQVFQVNYTYLHTEGWKS